MLKSKHAVTNDRFLFPLYDQKFSYILIEVNPSAFQNGMALENRVKIGDAMSKNVRGCMLTALKCQNFRGLLRAPKNGF